MRYEMPEVNKTYKMTVAHKVNGINENQPNTTMGTDGICYTTRYIKVTNIKEGTDDHGSYIYFGFVPVGVSRFSLRFGYERIYHNGNPFKYGIVGFEETKVVPSR